MQYRYSIGKTDNSVVVRILRGAERRILGWTGGHALRVAEDGWGWATVWARFFASFTTEGSEEKSGHRGFGLGRDPKAVEQLDDGSVVVAGDCFPQRHRGHREILTV